MTMPHDKSPAAEALTLQASGPDPMPEPKPSAGGAAAADMDALAEAVAKKVAAQLDALAARRYLSVAEAAAYSSLSPDSIRSLLSSGKLTALRPVAGRVVIDKRELDSLIGSSTRAPRRGRGFRPRAG